MNADLPLRIAEAYRWHRGLGAHVIEAPNCQIVVDASKPDVWDCNHAAAVSACTESEIADVFAAMDRHLAHTRWRVFHTDGFTPEPFLARLAYEGFSERPVTIQMALDGEIANPWPDLDLRPVDSVERWAALSELVVADHAEGLKTGGMDIGPEVSAGIVAGYRAKLPACRFYLAYEALPAAYGAYAAAPNGLGMIEDLFTRPERRRRGIITAMVASFAARLRAEGCGTVFLGALADQGAKRLYARLGFRPVSLARAWVKETVKSAR